MTYDLIIVGGGPAGITAGIYAGRQKMKTLIITKDFGGQIAKKAVMIENYTGFPEISGMDLIKNFVDHLKKQEDVSIQKDEVVKIEKNGDVFSVFGKSKKKYEALSVIVSSGADPRPLEVKGEKEFLGRGVSYCVTCDGPVFKDKKIAIIGGGDAGMEAAIFMANYASEIFILEYGKELKADLKNQERAKKTKKIKFITGVSVKEIKGDKFVNGLEYEEVESKEMKSLEIQGVFVEIGNHPATAFVKGLADFNNRDEIMVEFETFETKTKGLFAAGDVNVGKYKQIVAACGEGCKALLAAYRHVSDLKYK